MAHTIEGAAGGPVKATTIMSATEDFDPVIARLETLAERLTNCGDKIAGSRPSEVANSKDHPTPQHLIVQLQERRQRLVRAVDRVEMELQRIEGGLS